MSFRVFNRYEGNASNVQSSTRDGKIYSLNGVNIEKGTRFPGALA